MKHPSYDGIVVLGFPRSGTTLLRRLLNAHPSISCPSETYLLSAAARFLQEHPFAEGFAVGPLSGLGFVGIERNEVLDRVRQLIFGFFRDIASKAGKPVWAEKTAFDSFHIDAIEEICGNRCRYVCLFRHPLDCVCSVKELADKMETYLPELHEYVRRFQAPLEAFAHAWADVNRRLLQFVDDHPGEAVSIRYEDLVAQPGKQLERVIGLTGLSVDIDEWLGRAMGEEGKLGFGDWKTYQSNRITGASIERWHELHVSVVARLAPIVESLLDPLGYPQVEIAEKLGPTEARHRYQLRLMAARMKASAQVRGRSDD